MRGEQASKSDIVAGSVTAGCLSTLLGHPLDTIKVHKQVNPALANSSALQVVRFLSQGSFMRLFRGISAPMANQVLMNTVMFSTFDRTRSFASERLDGNAAAMGAGLLSGFATACLSTPADWFKIRSQISLSSSFDGSATSSLLSVLKRDAETNGKRRPFALIRTIYRGHLANLCREGVFTMVYLGLYDRARHALSTREGRHLKTVEVLVMSSTTGALAWIASYPFDTVKTIVQADRTVSTAEAARRLYRSSGVRGFFRGAGASTFRAMLVTSSRMVAYEMTLQILTTI